MKRNIICVLCIIWVLVISQSCDVQYPTAPIKEPSTVSEEPIEDGVDISATVYPGQSLGTISDKLTGFNLLYCFEKDELWGGDPEKKLVEYLEGMKTKILRYPGGKILEAWHWDNPNGQPYMDNWKADYDPANDKDPSEYMDLQEYMALIAELDAEPLLGINIASGIISGRGVNASVDEAKRLVQHCLDNNYNVTYYYLGNEHYHSDATLKLTAEEYGEEVNRFATAMRQIDPNIKIVVNWERNVTATSMAKLLNIAGDNIDIMELHWYWSWGTSTWDLWRSQIPMSAKNQWYTAGKPHFEEVKKFKDFAAKLGHDHIEVASLEWNLGPSPSDQMMPDTYQIALMQGEMLMQFMEGGVVMATFWPLHWPDSSDKRYVLDAKNDYSPRYTLDLFSLLGSLQGGDLLKINANTSQLYAVGSGFYNGAIRVALLNKNFSEQKFVLNVEGGFSGKKVTSRTYKETNIDGEAEVVLLECQTEGEKIYTSLPPYSITVINIE